MKIAEILEAMKLLLEAEKKVEELVAGIKEAIDHEKDKKKRKALQDAFRGRDADRLRKLLFDL